MSLIAMILLTTLMAVFATISQALPSLQLQARHDSYSKVRGLQFSIDGEKNYFAGTNAYWLAFKGNQDIDLVFDQLQTSGLKVIRFWGFNDITSADAKSGVWFQSLIPGEPPVINEGPNGLQRLDYVISSAEKHGMKLIIPFTNNWEAYGGMGAYRAYYNVSSIEWYTSTVVQNQYIAYVEAVVSRYKTSKAVFAWELANEPRCHGCPTTVITEWARQTSRHIKGLDPNHMVTLGDEGWMNGGGDGSYPYTAVEGIDFVENLKISTLDFGTFHLYPLSWSQPDSFGNDWITNHAAACKAARKPCVLEEYGTTYNHTAVQVPWQETCLSVKDAGIASDVFWGFGTYFTDGEPSGNPVNNYEIFYNSSDWEVLVTDHVAAIGGA